MTPIAMPTTVSKSRSRGYCQASLALIAATTTTTVVVMPVVTMSSRRCNSAITSVPMPRRIAKPTGLSGKIKRYGKHNAKLTQVAISRAIPADRAGHGCPEDEDDGNDSPHPSQEVGSLVDKPGQ